MTQQQRQPTGVPTGGQFATSARAESDVALDGAQSPYAVVEGSTRQTAQPYERLSLATENRGARELARLLDGGTIDACAPYQRASVWSLDQRIALVRSWCQGVPVPAIMINDRTNYDWIRRNGDEHLSTGQGMYAVVDGKQRIETAGAWFRGDFAVPASWFRADDVETTIDTEDGPYVTYLGLTQRGQTVMGMGGSMLPMTTAKVGSIEEEADLYLLVNGGGTAQTENDMANAARIAAGGSR